MHVNLDWLFTFSWKTYLSQFLTLVLRQNHLIYLYERLDNFFPCHKNTIFFLKVSNRLFLRVYKNSLYRYILQILTIQMALGEICMKFMTKDWKTWLKTTTLLVVLMPTILSVYALHFHLRLQIISLLIMKAPKNFFLFSPMLAASDIY